MRGYQLPPFSTDSYANLLCRLIDAGYQFQKVSQMRNRTKSEVVYLRHDVDLHINLVSAMALIEKDLNVSSTYFVPLTLHFNALYPPNQQIMRELIGMGHEIGLHYDMETYPTDPRKARAHLDWEAQILGKIIEQPIRTICMHNPHKGQADPFCQLDDYVHPHDPRCQEGLLYVSDSCRAWRDERLLSCFGPNPPLRLMLLIHPELWLDGTVRDRIKYLDCILMDKALRQHRDYFDHKVRPLWLAHPAARLHDERQQKRKMDP